jgi:hypothetical protein
MAPLDTLLGLLDELDGLRAKELHTVFLRTLYPTDQGWQLEMDRRQTDVDIRRAEIKQTMAYIANSN